MPDANDSRPPRRVPGDNADWQRDAACRGTDGSAFFRNDDERGALARRRDLRAKAICNRCPVKAMCLAWALHLPELYGIWGGLTAQERQQFRDHY